MCVIWNYDFICIMCLLYVFAFIVRASLFLGAIFGSNKLWNNGKVTVNNIWINDTNRSRLYSFWIYISAWVHRFIFGERKKNIENNNNNNNMDEKAMNHCWTVWRCGKKILLQYILKKNIFSRCVLYVVCTKQLLIYICNRCSKIA